MTVSIAFTWQKDARGYRLVKRGSLPGNKPTIDTIMPNGGALILIHPMEVADKYRIFSKIDSAEGLLGFVKSNGLLGHHIGKKKGTRHFRDPIDGSESVKQYEYEGMPVRPYLKKAALFRDALRLKAEGSVQLAAFLQSTLRSTFEDNRAPAILGDQSIMGHLHLIPDKDSGARFQVTPVDLMQALWFQLGQVLVSNIKLSSCLHCGQLFEAGLQTGRRVDAKFCSDEHRKLYHRLNRKPARRS